jgi:hypothetical protein
MLISGIARWELADECMQSCRPRLDLASWKFALSGLMVTDPLARCADLKMFGV